MPKIINNVQNVENNLNKEDILNLVKGNVEVSNSNIDLSKNGIYEFYVNDRKHNVEVNIDSNNKPNLDVNVGSNNIPNVLVKEPIIEEKIIYKVLNNRNSKENKNDNINDLKLTKTLPSLI